MYIINIFCLKWGAKYDKDWVIRLYNLCRKNIKHEFTFYCYTDKSFEHKDVNILEIPDSDKYLSVWWHKIGLFNIPEFQDQNNLFFDLDMFIREDITNEIEQWFSTITEKNYLSMAWCPVNGNFEWNNSSIFVWKDSKTLKEKIYDYVMADEFKIMFRYVGFDMLLLDMIELGKIKIGKLSNCFKRVITEYNEIGEYSVDLIHGNFTQRMYLSDNYKILSFNAFSINSINNISAKIKTKIDKQKSQTMNIIKTIDFTQINKNSKSIQCNSQN